MTNLLPFFQYIVYPITIYLYFLGIKAFKKSQDNLKGDPKLLLFRRNMIFMFLCTITMLVTVDTFDILGFSAPMLWYLYDLATLGVYIYYIKKILKK